MGVPEPGNSVRLTEDEHEDGGRVISLVFCFAQLLWATPAGKNSSNYLVNY